MVRKTVAVLLIATAVALPGARGHAQTEFSSTPYSWSVTRGGVGRYVVGKWGIVGVDVANRTGQPTELLSTVSLDDESNVQFGRRLWIPPQAKRSAWYLVRPWTEVRRQPGQLDIRSLLLDTTGPQERPLSDSAGRLFFQERVFPLHGDGPLTALISDGEDDVAAAVVAIRKERNLSAEVIRLDDVPPTAAGLQALDQLVLSSDGVKADSAGLTAIRRWVRAGGRLWVMLDRIEAATATSLLGSAFNGCYIVDRASLTDVQVMEMRPADERPAGPVCRFEHPVELVRVMAPGMRVTHTVDGWPAAFWQEFGEGEVLFTTMEARGWLHPDGTESLGQLAFEFMSTREPPPIESRQLERFVSERIGYEVVSRGRVAAVLGTFCFALLGVGIWLARRERLEHFLWCGPIVAAVAALILAGMGHASRHAVRPTVSVAQVVQVVPGAEEVQLSGLLGLYTPEESSGPLGVRNGGVFWPEPRGAGGTVRRMVATDLDEWQWERLTLSDGLLFASFTQDVKLDRPIAARATLGPEGLSGGFMSGPYRDFSDALLALPAQRNIAVRFLDEDGTFTAGSRDVLAPGQFFTDRMVSDEQRRRRAVYERLLGGGSGDRRPFPFQPTLLVWASPLEMGFRFPDEAEQVGAALLLVPLELERPAPGTNVVIPAPLMRYRAIGIGTAATYEYETGEWLGPFSQAWNTTLRFQLPQEVLPIQLHRAALSVALRAPSRDLEITVQRDGDMVPLATRRSPIGRVQFELDGAALPELDEGGGLILGVNVGPARDDESNLPLDPNQAQIWKIDDVQLEVAGQTLAP